ncbi:MAG TPA: DUF4157 domain-containing protein [Blastocatellia bacterium]|nr:DUF4157 domain-containing protein [Blastocatellia bacterium]
MGLQRAAGNRAVDKVIQPKLAISRPGDHFEQEADRAAEQVMSMPAPREAPVTPAAGHLRTSLVQRRCKECEDELQRKPKSAGDERAVQTGEGAGEAFEVSRTTQSQIDTLRGGGQPMTEAARAFFEPRFGHDFSDVRVHNSGTAAALAQSVNARAFTVGRDIVFDSGQYAPHTDEGRRLLAHELAHTIQQSGASHVTPNKKDATKSVAAAKPNADPGTNVTVGRGQAGQVGLIASQSGGGAQVARQKNPAPAGPQGWAGCDQDEVNNLNSELAQANDWVKGAIGDLQAKEIPTHTKRALSRYLTADDAKVKSVILPNLKAILADLAIGSANFRCQTKQQCNALFPNGANAYSGNPITLCPGYFEKGELDRVTTLVHESGHNAGLMGNVVQWQWPFPGLNEKERLGNTESYAAFVRSNKYPSTAPFEIPSGISVGAGAIFPGAGLSPRFLVRAQYDAVLKRRIFHFMDLHLGESVSVDTSGSILGSLSLGARSFAPLSLTGVPVFLDLRAGGVIGSVSKADEQYPQVLKNTELNVLGPSFEAGLGISSGRLGASVSYLHIFNFLKRNPDVDAVLVSGEIRFF